MTNCNKRCWFSWSTYCSRGVGVHLSHHRSRWPRYTLFSVRCNGHSHTGTDQEHMEDCLQGGVEIQTIKHESLSVFIRHLLFIVYLKYGDLILILLFALQCKCFKEHSVKENFSNASVLQYPIINLPDSPIRMSFSSAEAIHFLQVCWVCM